VTESRLNPLNVPPWPGHSEAALLPLSLSCLRSFLWASVSNALTFRGRHHSPPAWSRF